MNLLQVGNRFRGGASSHEKDSQVIVCSLILRCNLQDRAEFLLSQIELLFGKVDIANIVVRCNRLRSELQGIAKCSKSSSVILLLAFNDTQEVETVCARVLAAACRVPSLRASSRCPC